tara:strand:- start:146 stop:547 length:402 start_codon:yes stop_codon:yes gene_type:complete
MQQKFTNQELVTLLQGLYGVQNLKGIKFALKIARNISVIKQILEPIEDVAAPSREFMELSQKVGELEKSKDTKGIKKLEKENKELVDARKKQLAELQEIMKEEVEIDLVKIEEGLLPEEITAGQINGIETLIK